MFRNVRFYRFDSGWPKTEDESSQLLTTCAFRPCGPLTLRSSGWVPPSPEAGDSLVRRVNGADLVRLRSQSRVLPPSAVAEELEHRIEDYVARMREQPSPREKRKMKAEARDELMPKALLKSDRYFGFVDLKQKLIAIDAAQASVSERFLRRLGAAVTLANVRPLQFQKPLGDLLSAIFLGDTPQQFAAGRECRMQDAADYGAKVRWTNFDLSDPSIRTHVAGGMRLTHLAIVYDNILSCVIDEDGIISKLRFVGMEEDNSDELEPIARQDAEFVLLSGTLRNMIADLEKLLGGMI
jgi:recombination associated protein RdgC